MFNADGTKIYMTNNGADDIYEWPLSTAWDVTTAGTTVSFDDAANVVWRSAQWSEDGTYLFITDVFTNHIERFTADTPFDVTDLQTPHGQIWDYVTQGGFDDDSIGWAISTDGLKLMIVGTDTTDMLKVFTFGTAWDLSTLTEETETLATVALLTIRDMIMSPDGTILYVLHNSDNIDIITMTAAYDPSTGTLNTSNTLDVGTTDTINPAGGIAMSKDATKLYVTDATNGGQKLGVFTQ